MMKDNKKDHSKDVLGWRKESRWDMHRRRRGEGRRIEVVH